MSRARNVIIWAGVAMLGGAVNKILDYPNSIWLQILPNSVLRLNREFAGSLAMTLGASVATWMAAVCSGYLLGLIAGASVLNTHRSDKLVNLGKAINKTYEALYVIPFVLTVSFVYALAMSIALKYHSVWLVVPALLLVGGLALGGHQVYKSVYEAVVNAKDDNRWLVGSLFSKHGARQSLRRSFEMARRLSDCEMLQVCTAVGRAFSLAVVAVMIIEAVTPSFYELLVPQNGAVQPWLRGAGREIIVAQNSQAFVQIAGCIWVVLSFVWIIQNLADIFMHRRWLRHYGVRR